MLTAMILVALAAITLASLAALVFFTKSIFVIPLFNKQLFSFHDLIRKLNMTLQEYQKDEAALKQLITDIKEVGTTLVSAVDLVALTLANLRHQVQASGLPNGIAPMIEEAETALAPLKDLATRLNAVGGESTDTADAGTPNVPNAPEGGAVMGDAPVGDPASADAPTNTPLKKKKKGTDVSDESTNSGSGEANTGTPEAGNEQPA